MVTCSELATIVATDSNSFLVWGSRPLIKSPLSHVLSGQVSVNDSNDTSSPTQKADSDNDSANPDSCSSPDSGYRDSSVASPDSKSSLSAESVSKQGRRSNEAINKQSSKSSVLMGGRRQSSMDLALAFIPTIQVSCIHSHEYLAMLNTAMGDTAKPHTATTKQSATTIGAQVQSRLKKGSSGNIHEACHEGVILQPTVVDLVNKSGILMSLLEQGLMNVKLEGIASFGPNLIVLLHAHVSTANQPDADALSPGRRMVIGPRLR